MCISVRQGHKFHSVDKYLTTASNLLLYTNFFDALFPRGNRFGCDGYFCCEGQLIRSINTSSLSSVTGSTGSCEEDKSNNINFEFRIQKIQQ
jgi:hypothetical protein